MRVSFERRAARARQLAARNLEAREPLAFYAAVADFQASAAPDDRAALEALVRQLGPGSLRAAALPMSDESWRTAVDDYRSGRDRASPRSFFVRAQLQMSASPAPAAAAEGGCPSCGYPPQAGALRREGDGSALHLVCSICLREWRVSRTRCPACGEEDAKKLSLYRAEEMACAQVRACETCGRYLLAFRTDLEPASIPDVDEMAALALSVWANERGYRKIQPSLVGI